MIKLRKIKYPLISLVAVLLSVAHLPVAAQFTLKINLQAVPSAHPFDSIFIAGQFNNWNPHNPQFALNRTEQGLSITISGLKEDVYSFKFTRGSWNTVETGTSGKEMENRVIDLSSDSTVAYLIEGWKDDFPETAIPHTASPNVKVMDTAFWMPGLNRSRKITVYLPNGYEKTKQRYPVMYMHDGQNLFDEKIAVNGEWGIDECLDSMRAAGRKGAIIVGIDNGPKRMTEYNPYPFRDFGEPEGGAYVDFIVRDLKPYIDKHYRTLKSKESTTIAGSSLGAVISYYALLKYPDVFGNAGIFSPAFWTAPGLKTFTDSLAAKARGKVFFYMGALEGDDHVGHMKAMADQLGELSGAVIYRVIDPNGSHNEKAWRKWFAEFYYWITGDGFNSPVSLWE